MHKDLRSEVDVCTRNAGAASEPCTSVLSGNVGGGPDNTISLEGERARRVWRRVEERRQVGARRR